MIVVELKRSKTRWPLRRPQRWYWVARSAGNGKTLAQSSEMYSNSGDAVAAVQALFGPDTELRLPS